MPKPRIGKWEFRDYLYSLLNQGESLDSAPERFGEILASKEQNPKIYEIVLVVATHAEAERLLALIAAAMHVHLSRAENHRFTAYGLDQSWRPQQLFDEVHWFDVNPAPGPPSELLASLGRIVHIHQIGPSERPDKPGFRIYRWASETALTEFLASLYLARETSGVLQLNWDSYFAWQPSEQCHGLVTASWGGCPSSAIDALLTQVTATKLTVDDSAILIIEGNTDTTFGDCFEIVDALERNLNFGIVTTCWLSPNYLGYGLKLLTFCRQ